MSSLPEPGAVPDFETWFRTSAGRLLRQAYYFTRDLELAEDIAQDAAVKVFKALARRRNARQDPHSARLRPRDRLSLLPRPNQGPVPH
jgi:DNA-directed RNA polymerase specialized sigma24 family protein